MEEATKNWLDTLRDAAAAELGRPRSRAYHFSPDGSDETGDGSRERPWRTQAKAQEILDREGDVAILFRRGDVLTAPLAIRHENVTVGSYVDPEYVHIVRTKHGWILAREEAR